MREALRIPYRLIYPPEAGRFGVAASNDCELSPHASQPKCWRPITPPEGMRYFLIRRYLPAPAAHEPALSPGQSSRRRQDVKAPDCRRGPSMRTAPTRRVSADSNAAPAILFIAP